MRKNRLIVIMLLYLLITINSAELYAQRNFYSMPSQDGVSMINAIKSPVNHSSGIMTVQVPIHTISDQGINLPISLNYQASGIKIADKQTGFGLGWRLIAGGRITRIVKGRPDELTKQHASDYSSLSAICDAVFYIEKGERKINSSIDCEPDLYFFEIPGASGMFVCDCTSST